MATTKTVKDSIVDRTFETRTMCNRDLAGLVERIDETIYEVAKCQSGGLLALRDHALPLQVGCWNSRPSCRTT